MTGNLPVPSGFAKYALTAPSATGRSNRPWRKPAADVCMVVDDSDIRNLGNNKKTLWRMKRLMRLLQVCAHPYFGNTRHAELRQVPHQPRQALRTPYALDGGPD